MDRLLADALAANNLVIVVGTGATAAATEGRAPTATWKGFLESGINRVQAAGNDDRWATLQRENLAYGFQVGRSDELLSAAGNISSRVTELGEQGLSNWLRDDIGHLTSSSHTWSEALSKLPFPLMTTNYDTLLDGERGSAVWTNSSDVQAALAGLSRKVVHLHGIWDQAETAIISGADYQRLLSSETAQHLQKAASSLKSLVYVGYGAGLDDPNFDQLIRWHRSKFVPSTVTHFRLCLNNELATLQALHAGDHIHPVAYGDTYDELPEFLEKLHPTPGTVAISEAGIVQDLVSESQSVFSSQLIDDSIIRETLQGDDDLSLDDVVLPPVLLPVPHAQYIKSRRVSKDSPKIKRLDPHEEAHGHDVVVVVGDENSGLTTAVKWLALEAARYVGGAAPLYVSFRSCRPSGAPLHDQLVIASRNVGLTGKRDKTLPDHVLALDDFSIYVPKISDRVLSELARNEAVSTIIGCVQGAEDELVERLRAVGLSATVRYLGRLSSVDVRKMAQMASPGHYAELAKQVLEVIQSENLQKTPYTIALLLAVLIRSGVVTPAASQTSVLDDYVGLILGRGDPHDDARLGLDQTGREAILGRLAQAFVGARAGGLPESDVVQVMQDTFNRLGWGERPSDVLSSFLDRGILRHDGKHISFYRSSYLHLFIAKRAIVAPEFLEELLLEPLFFAAAITDYAALFRHDSRLIKKLAELLDDDEWVAQPGGVFDSIEPEVPNLEELVAVHAEDSATMDVDTREPLQDDTTTVDIYFDTLDDDDRPPFPIANESDMTPVFRLMRTLELVSNTLRDSDQVEDLPLKQAALTDVLNHWGIFMSLMSTDSSLKDFVSQMLAETSDLSSKSPEVAEEMTQEWIRLFPALVSAGGIASGLASRRLTVALDRAVADRTIFRSEQTVIAAAFFIVALQDEGWIARLSELLKDQGNIWIIRNFLLFLCLGPFMEDTVSQHDEDNLLELCLDLAQRAYSYRDTRDRSQHRESIKRSYLQNRLQARGERRSREVAGDEDGEEG